MDLQNISFENLPQAVAFLIRELAEIKHLVSKEDVVIPLKKIPIGIDEVASLIGKAKPTIYTLVRERKIPCYKNGKKLYFFEEEILNWISKGKKKTLQEITEECEADFKKNRRRQHN
ncbi:MULTISPECIES: helix-turn-helix domain-containing protein [Chryseobacterium group]|jgi:excisionase family DNA binding protein|uniref:DNA-binding protein n=5 Tax=Chryseobacterium group TaxID=2782232 RepID=A0A3N0X8G0_9FLAO|nr:MULTISPECIES: helix-turn-helix domain-containing protein [Chryseobacterium group]OJX29550.1 MAG: DNA-binding protein [Chryseobacterium sp. 36-9]EFK33148.1 DNA binding domain, excisionase family [Chryseobacterium gleum ATCC 35910]MDN4013245.1 helix-turn-helix domain-containing protein [Chryseobacterium gambrini]MDN4028953.1 helix-turn-helix domain-containing protein [Chryseobacterium gambrini]MDO3425204.1 helix-turn-helix domain-containing protein [Chryseobacterium sp. APV1]